MTNRDLTYRIDVEEFFKIVPYLKFSGEKKRVLTHLTITAIILPDEFTRIAFPSHPNNNHQ